MSKSFLTERVGLAIEPDIKAKLDAIAQREERSIGNIVRRAIRDYLAKETNQQ